MSHTSLHDFDLRWYNFDTKSYDVLPEPPFDSIESVLPYLPNEHPQVERMLFRVLVEHKGMSIEDAYMDVSNRMCK